LGDSRSPLIFLAISAVLNIGLDILFIKAFGTGVGGAATATIISQFVASALCILYIKKKYEILIPEKSEVSFRPHMCRNLLSIGLPMALQFSITAIGTIIIQNEINKLGTNYVVAVTAAQKIQNIVTGPMECLGVTLATFCGQNKGARNYSRILDGLKKGTAAELVYCVGAYAFINLLGRYIAMMFVDSSETAVLDLAMHYLHLTSLFFPFLGVLFLFRNSLQGMGYSMLPMTAGITELIARFLAAELLVAAVGYTGVCLSAPLAWAAADVLLIITAIVKLPKLKKELAN
jgi:Na+-driven multidrug efflux pump